MGKSMTDASDAAVFTILIIIASIVFFGLGLAMGSTVGSQAGEGLVLNQLKPCHKGEVQEITIGKSNWTCTFGVWKNIP